MPFVHAELYKLHANIIERVKRLETELIDLATEHASVRDSHMKLLKRTTGGGRPPGPASRNERSALDAIPHGDKDALRQHFAAEIKARGRRTTEQ